MKTIDNYIQEKLIINSKSKRDIQIEDIDTIDKLFKYINAKLVKHYKVLPSSKLEIYTIHCDVFHSLLDKPGLKKGTYLNKICNDLSTSDLYVTKKCSLNEQEYSITIQDSKRYDILSIVIFLNGNEDITVYGTPELTSEDEYINALQIMAKIHDFIKEN